MTERERDELKAEAIAWHLRLRDDGAEAFEAFALWLDADPARSDAYDAVALADAELAPADFLPRPPTTNPRRHAGGSACGRPALPPPRPPRSSLSSSSRD